MRDRIRFWLKITAAMAIGLVVYAMTHPATTSEIIFGYKTLFISQLGTPAQVEAVINEAGRRVAAESGDLELYEARVAFREAVEAQQRLARLDPGLADCAVSLATTERDERRAAMAQNYP